MTDTFERSLGISAVAVTVSNTTSLTSIFSDTIEGSSLGTNNGVEWEMSSLISFANGGILTLSMLYAGATVAACSIGATTGVSNVGLTAKAKLGADGSINAQFGTIEACAGLAYSNTLGTPVGWGTATGASGGDQTFEIKAQWNAASSSNTFVHRHSTLVLLGHVEDPDPVELDEPTFQILTSSKLNNLHYTTRQYAYFYAPLLHHLTFFGYGDVSFLRAGGTSSAIWRDGGARVVENDEPRFEYDGETVKGLKINSATETLTFSSQNSLNDSNTLCYLLNGAYKSTRRGDPNIFNSSGVLIGVTNSYITEIVKFNKQISEAEDNATEVALTS